MTTPSITLRTPAKINLTLAVFARRADGFHELESWVVPIGLFDELTFSPSASLELLIRGTKETLSADSSNLAWKAAAALAEAAHRPPRARIELYKRIPIGAGLGGGSSDAAATLVGLNRLWKLGWPVERLAPIAARIGSDAPFFLSPRPAILRSRGDVIESAPDVWKGWVVLIVPGFSLSTAEVYRQHAGRGWCRHDRPAPWTAGTIDGCALSRFLFNDLEPSAFTCEPRLARLHGMLDGLDGRAVRMTGSGSALFTIFDQHAGAREWSRRAQERLDADHRAIVVETIRPVEI